MTCDDCHAPAEYKVDGADINLVHVADGSPVVSATYVA